MKSSTKSSIPPVTAHVRLFELGGLYAALAKLVDPRKARGKRYALALVLLLVILAKLCGEDRPLAIAQWAAAHAEYLVAALQLCYAGMPSHNTIRRILQMVDPAALQAIENDFLGAKEAAERSVLITIDGKTLRGTICAGASQGVHLLAAYLPQESLVIAQVAVGNKENEIVGAPKLLQCLDLRGKIVMADAVLTQRELSEQIVVAGGHFIWLAKDNQPGVRQRIAELFELPSCVLARDKAKAFPSVTTFNKDHGRLETRTLTASELLNGYLKWPHLGQVFRIERQFVKVVDGSIHHEVVHGLTDLTAAQASPAELLSLIRDYWNIENDLHYRRDKTLHEDGTRMTLPKVAYVMATINNLVLSLILRAGWRFLPEARRHFEGHPDEALRLILRSP
jgi:predicted transposase YbfD/YdcC